MSGFIQSLAGLSPAAQLVVAMTFFALVIAIMVSPTAMRNMIDFIKVIARLFYRTRKPPKEPPTKNAA